MKWPRGIGSAEPERRLIRLGILSPDIRKLKGRAMTVQHGAPGECWVQVRSGRAVPRVRRGPGVRRGRQVFR